MLTQEFPSADRNTLRARWFASRAGSLGMMIVQLALTSIIA